MQLPTNTLTAQFREPAVLKEKEEAPWFPVLKKNSNQEPFQLQEEFYKQFIGKQPKWGPVGYITYKGKYARSLDCIPERYQQIAASVGLRKTEEFWLTILRVVEGTYRIQQNHCLKNNVPWRVEKAQRSAQEMYQRIWDGKFCPPGRGFWMMGTDYVKKVGGAALNNCAFVSTSQISTAFSAPFTFLMDMSMLGVGVGFDCRGAGTVRILSPDFNEDVHYVEDSREGWVELIRRVLDAFVGKDTLPKSVDTSGVRPAGVLIKGFGGVAAGPGPLIQLYEDLIALLTKRAGQYITSRDITDIGNMIGRCVVAGNIRRSAEIVFGEHDDQEFANLKNYEVNPERANWGWASNNSIFAEIGMDYADSAEQTVRHGDPGYEWLENARAYGRMGRAPDWKDKRAAGGNPCLEQTLESFELCCLVETFPANHDSYEDYQRTLKFAYLYAKTVTLVPTHDERTNSVMLRNRRIGTSMTGIVQAMKKIGRREFFVWCDKGYEYLERLDDIYSEWMCVPLSRKKTSVKPAGTVSKLYGATEGMHHPVAEYYYNVQRFPENNPMVTKFRAAGYRVEKVTKEPNTVAVYLPSKVEHFDRSVDQVSIWEQLEIAAQLQTYWADNQVSVTVTFQPHEAGQIKYALELYETRLKGVSFLPLLTYEEMVQRGFEHPPQQPITREQYETYLASLQPIDLSDQDQGEAERFCDGDRCVRV